MNLAMSARSARPAGTGEVQTQVLFFGRVGDRLGRSATVAIPAEGCALSDLRARLAASLEGAAEALSAAGVRAAVDQFMAAGDVWIRPGAEVAFFSAFSGG